MQKFSPPKSKRRSKCCIEIEAKKDPVGMACFEAPAFRFAAEPVATGGTTFPNGVQKGFEAKSREGFFLFQGRAARIVLAALEPFHKFCSRTVRPSGSGLFGFWLRFRSVTGHCGHALSLKPCQKPKILAPRGCRIFETALGCVHGNHATHFQIFVSFFG